MGLTQEQFLQVRRALRLAEVPAKDDPPGKRNSARWSVNAIVGFAPCRGTRGAAAQPAISDAGAVEPPAKWVSLIDLSPTGASILSRTQFGPGEHFVLALPADGEEHLPAVCLVQYSRVKLDGTFRIGAQFCDPADAGAQDLQAALAALKEIGLYVIDPAHAAASAAARATAESAAPPRPAEPRPAQSQRRSERRMAEGRAVIHTYDEIGEPGPIEEVPALDFSETGVCIFRREPLKVGDHFMARVPVLNAQPIISMCRVVTCAPCEGQSRFRIGAEFVSPPGLVARLAKRVLRLFSSAA